MHDVEAKAFRDNLAAGGACGALVAARDWGTTALGAVETWPASLRIALSLVLRSPMPMLLLWGADGVMLYNDAFARFAGSRHPELLGSAVRTGWHEAAAFNDTVMRTVLGGGVLQYRDKALTLLRSGRPEQVRVNLDCSPVPGEDGRPAGVLCVLADTTEQVASERQRAEAEVALAESEAQFRQMVDTVPQIVWITDADGRMEFLNRQFSIYTGAPYRSMSPAEIAGAFIHPDDAPLVVAAFQAARDADRPHVCEHRIRSATGEYRWFMDRAEAFRDQRTGKVLRWFGTSVDIHDRKLAEDGLRDLATTLERRVAERTAERNMLATIVENTDVMVMAVDLDYNILALNAANADEFERIFGIRPKAGDNMLDLLAPWPDMREEVRLGWARGLTGERVTFVDEFGDPNRVRPYYEVSFRPLFDEAGRPVGAYQFVTDVTDRLRGAAELLDTQDALRQAQKMEAMGQLTGGVAHDFNNLLTPIVATLDMLQRRGVGGEREQRLIAGAAQSAERARTLVQRLLAFARRQPLQPVAVDLAALVAGMEDLVTSTTGPRIAVALDAPEGLPLARADPNQLEMALLNLAVNARDAMPDGGTLRIAAGEARVEAGHRSGLETGTYLRLTVEDSGEGMDEATLARAVEPFFSTKGIGQGTGLGLSMVHGLALQLGGALTIQSRLGRGTTVELWLPRGALPAPPLDVVTATPSASAGRGGGRVLLVDDEVFVRMSTADMLDELGYEVIEASSAEEAARMIEDGTAFDLVVTDHLMPGMTGTELAHLVRQRRPDADILLVSGYADLEGVTAAVSRLTKPFRKEELAASLQRFADARRERPPRQPA